MKDPKPKTGATVPAKAETPVVKAPASGTKTASAAKTAAPVAGVPEAQVDLEAMPPPAKGMTRDELAKQYDPFVRSIAGKIKRTLNQSIEFEDLVGYGVLGLLEAADRYDPKYGANFMTFAYYRIRGAIYDGLRSMGWVSRTEYHRFRVESRSNAYLSSLNDQEIQTPPGTKKSAEEEVGELAQAVEGLVTIYVTALDAMEGFQIKDDRGPGLAESVEMSQARQLVAEAIAKLPEQERRLLELYYYQELPLEEVGVQLGLSKSWTSRLHARAVTKLAKVLKEAAPDLGPESGFTPDDRGGKISKQQTGPPNR